MPQFLRRFVPGGTFFFTVVTLERVRLFNDAHARKILGRKFRDCQARMPFTVDALVLLPEHFHLIMRLPESDTNYPARIGWIKKEFSKEWLAAGGTEGSRTHSLVKNRRRAIWQKRFWEHEIRDERDFETHFDYVHFNPVKHGHVTDPSQWPESTIHRYLEAEWYPHGWGTGEGFGKSFDTRISDACE